jgi:hypothetical protein
MEPNGTHAPVATPVADLPAAVAENLPENPVAKRLFLAVQEVEGEITKIDQTIARVTAEKDQEVAKLQSHKEELFNLLRQYGGINRHHAAAPKKVSPKSVAVAGKKRKGPPPGSPSRKAPPGEKTIPELILEYMENNRKATTGEIRNYLDDLGRSTNPGVELGRLVKKNKIKLVERGNYQLAK